MFFIVIYQLVFGTREPEDEHLHKAVLILINIYQTLRLNKIAW